MYFLKQLYLRSFISVAIFKELHLRISLSLSLYTYIYIYIHIETIMTSPSKVGLVSYR